MKKISDQSGFSAVESLLVLVLVAIVGGIGYYVYHANNSAIDSYNAASNSSSAPVVKTKASSTSTATPKSSDASLNAAASAADPNDSSSTQDLNDATNSLNAN